MHTNVAAPEGEIHSITLSDLDELVSLHSEYLNYGEGIRPHFQRALTDESTIALKYMIEGKTAGILIYTKGISLSGGHPKLCGSIEKLVGGELTYTGDALLVKKEYRHMSVNRKLFQEVRRLLILKEIKYTLHELWVHPNGFVPALGVIKTFGEARYLGQFDNFYKDFYHFGYVCPICGKDCICSAQIYLCKTT